MAVFNFLTSLMPTKKLNFWSGVDSSDNQWRVIKSSMVVELRKIFCSYCVFVFV